MDILGNGSLTKKVLREGAANTRPIQGAEVTVHIEGRAKDGEVFMNTRDGDPLIFVLGDGEVFPAVDMTVALMDVGELAHVSAESRFVFNSNGHSLYACLVFVLPVSVEGA